MKPSLRKTAFTTPYRSLYIQFHIWAETTVGTAQGMRTAVRTMPRPFRFAFSVSATTSPSTVSRMTETAANLTVFVTARHHSGSWASETKFANPTHCCAPRLSRLALVNEK